MDFDPSGLFSSGILKPSPVKELVAGFGEAVVSIETPSGKGSGFIINKEGYAITNVHVIQGETRIAAILYQNSAGDCRVGASRTSRSWRSMPSSTWR